MNENAAWREELLQRLKSKQGTIRSDPVPPPTMEDIRRQMRQIRRLGSLGDILRMIPGLDSLANNMPDMNAAEADMRRIEGIIDAMTPEERLEPDRIDDEHRSRIAKGSGTTPAEVGEWLEQFRNMSQAMRQRNEL